MRFSHRKSLTMLSPVIEFEAHTVLKERTLQILQYVDSAPDFMVTLADVCSREVSSTAMYRLVTKLEGLKAHL